MTRKPSATRAKLSPSARAQYERRTRARWAFYADLGTLRLAETKLRVIASTYATVQHPTCYETDPALANDIYAAQTLIAKIYARLYDSHRNDWKRIP